MITLNVNGQSRQIDADPEMPLLWALRDLLKLTGTKYGCGVAACGACTVHIDDQATRSCVLPVSAVAGKKVTTIEGLAEAGVQVAGRVGHAFPSNGHNAAYLQTKRDRGGHLLEAPWAPHPGTNCRGGARG